MAKTTTATATTTTWRLTGNAGTNPATSFLGTTDSKPLSIQPGTGNVGIGTKTPSGKLEVNGNSEWSRRGFNAFGRQTDHPFLGRAHRWQSTVDPS